MLILMFFGIRNIAQGNLGGSSGIINKQQTRDPYFPPTIFYSNFIKMKEKFPLLQYYIAGLQKKNRTGRVNCYKK